MPVDRVVQAVSADRLTDERSREVFFRAHVEITGEIETALDGAQLYPGMPAEVTVVTGARTALDYIVAPIARSLERAMKEQ